MASLQVFTDPKTGRTARTTSQQAADNIFASAPGTPNRFPASPTPDTPPLPDPPKFSGATDTSGGTGTKQGGLGGFLSSLGISASRPAVDRADVERQLQDDLGNGRGALAGTYATKINKAQEDSNAEREALEGKLGTSRRFSSSAQAFIKHVSDENNRKIAELEVQRDEALSKYDLEFAKLVDQRIEDERKAQSDQIKSIFDMLQVAEKAKDLEGLEAGGADGAIVELVKAGTTDPGDIYLKLREQGKNYSLKQVHDALEALAPNASKNALIKFDGKASGALLSAGFNSGDIAAMQADLNSGASLEDVLDGLDSEAQKSAVRQALGISANAEDLTPGTGAKDGVQESIIRNRLFDKVASVLGLYPLSDADRDYVRGQISYFRDQGLGEQEIFDALSGWPADTVSPYNNSLRDIVFTNADPEENVSGIISQTATLLNGGKYAQAVNKIENFALDKAKAEPGYTGKLLTDTYTTRIDEIKRLLRDNTDYGDTGFIEGNFNKVLGKLKGARATEVKAKLTALYQTFRKENAGVAVTDSENQFLDNLFADINDPKGNFITKLDTFQTSILQAHNATRRRVGLPEVKVKDILDPTERLQLYSSDIYIPNDGPADL